MPQGRDFVILADGGIVEPPVSFRRLKPAISEGRQRWSDKNSKVHPFVLGCAEKLATNFDDKIVICRVVIDSVGGGS